MNCTKFVNEWTDVYPISDNELEITHFNLDPTGEYRVTFGN